MVNAMVFFILVVLMIGLPAMSVWAAVLAIRVSEKAEFAAKQAQRALEAEKSAHDDLKQTLVDILDEDGEIRGKLALPSAPVPEAEPVRLPTPPDDRLAWPNKTPCGALCLYAFEKNEDGDWRCRANRDQNIKAARKEFVDATGQCTMFRASRYAIESQGGEPEPEKSELDKRVDEERDTFDTMIDALQNELFPARSQAEGFQRMKRMHRPRRPKNG